MEPSANEHKKIEIQTKDGAFCRYPIRTHFVGIGEDYIGLVERYVKPYYQTGDILSVSEKVISLCQKRIVYKKDMKLTLLAKLLSGFASHSAAGIGVDSVWKMQFAIDICGRTKILYAAVCGMFGKLFGRKGVFYDIAGMEVKGLDGFYDRAFKEYGEYGIRIPECPDAVCDEIHEKTGCLAVIVDANDFTVDILGKASDVKHSDAALEAILRDNPSGQSIQLTPFVLIRLRAVAEQACEAAAQ